MKNKNKWLQIRKLFGEKCFKTFSDRGSVLSLEMKGEFT